MDAKMLDDVLAIVRQVGFPALVAGWFMFRLEQKLEKLTDSINELVTAYKRRG